MEKLYVSPHISLTEYSCNCCTKLPPSFDIDSPNSVFLEIFDAFEIIRSEFGKPMRVTGYRCPEHNIEVNGSYLSAHLFGCALDCQTGSWEESERFMTIVEDKFPDLRMGIYSWGCHIDNIYRAYPHASEFWRPGVRWQG